MTNKLYCLSCRQKNEYTIKDNTILENKRSRKYKLGFCNVCNKKVIKFI